MMMTVKLGRLGDDLRDNNYGYHFGWFFIYCAIYMEKSAPFAAFAGIYNITDKVRGRHGPEFDQLDSLGAQDAIYTSAADFQPMGNFSRFHALLMKFYNSIRLRACCRFATFEFSL